MEKVNKVIQTWKLKVIKIPLSLPYYSHSMYTLGMDVDPNKNGAIVTLYGYPLYEHSIRRIMNVENLSDEVR